MLGIVVAEERPDLEEAKNQLIISNAKMKQELKEIEDRILYRLSASEGSPVDDVDLIQTLEASKLKSQEIKVGRAGRFGHSLGQIGTKWEKSGTFENNFQYVLAQRVKNVLKNVLPDLSHLIPI